MTIGNEEGAVASPSPTLWNIRENCGISVARAFIVAHITSISEFSTAKGIDANIIRGIASEVVNTYGFLKVSEVSLWAAQVKAGKYIEFYGYIDGRTLLRSISLFIGWRNGMIDRIEKRKLEEQRQHRADGCVTREEYERMKREGKI